MNKLSMLILASLLCYFVPLKVFSNPLVTTGSVPLKMDSVLGYTVVSKTDSALSSKVIYQYSADSLEVCHHYYTKDSQKWIFSRADSTFYNNQKRVIRNIVYTYNVNTTKWTPLNKTENSYQDNLVTSVSSTYNITELKWNSNTKILTRTDSKSGKQTLNEVYVWNTSYNQFAGSQKTVSVLNESSDKVRDTVYTWNTTTMSWKKDMTIHNYNKSGKDTVSVSYTWDAAGSKWTPVFKYQYKTYTKGVNLFSENLTLSWNQNATRWDSAYRTVGYIYLYTAETESYYYVTHMPAGNSEWIQGRKSEFRYNQQGRIDTVLAYNLNSNGSTWDKSYNLSLLFTESGKVLNEVGYYNYDTNTHLYKTGAKRGITYDESEAIILQEDYSLDAATQQWIGSSKSVNTKGNPSRFDIYTWDKVAGDWYGVYSFGTLKNDDGKTKIQYIYSWNLNTKSWDLTSKDFYYYSEFKAPVIHTGYQIIDPVSGQHMTALPNPAKNTVQLTGSDIVKTDIISSAGKLVKTTGDNQTIDISSLPAGLYYFMVTVKNGDKQCLKVLKE